MNRPFSLRSRDVNLNAPTLPELAWRDGEVPANLIELRCWAERLASDTIN